MNTETIRVSPRQVPSPSEVQIVSNHGQVQVKRRNTGSASDLLRHDLLISVFVIVSPKIIGRRVRW